MIQDDIHEEIRKTLRGLAEKVVETLEGRDKVDAKACLTALKISEALDAFTPQKIEQLSDEKAYDVLAYLSLVYNGLLEFIRMNNLEA